MAERAARVREAAPVAARPSRAAAARLDPGLTRIRGNWAGSRSGVRVGAAGNASEREADRTADRVSALLGSRSADGPPTVGTPQHRRGPCGATARRCVPALDRGRGRTDGGAVSGGLAARIALTRGRGAALPDGVRAPMEAAFGADFSGVRVHAGSALPGRVASTAFTLGRDIHFAPGAYEPDRPSGQWLLAHELTHVVQQGGRPSPGIQRHASKEHYLLGALTPHEIANIAKAKESAATVNSKTMAAAKKSRRLQKMQTAGSNRYDAQYAEAVQAVQEQIYALARWQTATATNPDPKQVKRGGTGVRPQPRQLLDRRRGGVRPQVGRAAGHHHLPGR